MRALVNIAQLVGAALIVVAAAMVSAALACFVAGAGLCALAVLHDPDRGARR